MQASSGTLKDAQGKQIQFYGSIIDDIRFTETAYYNILQGYSSGMQFSRSHNDAEMCITYVSDLLDSFFKLHVNYTDMAVEISKVYVDTNGDGVMEINEHLNDHLWFWENTLFNITSIVSGPFQ